MSNTEVIDAVNSGYRMPPPSNCPAGIDQLMNSCWNNAPELRPNFKDIFHLLEHTLNTYKTSSPSFKASQLPIPQALGSQAIYANNQNLYSPPT